MISPTILLLLLLGVSTYSLVISPKLNAYQESKITGAAPGSKVTISVGEKNGFAYTVNGYTNSIHKIAVSGEYHDDPATHRGWVALSLVVDTEVYYYYLRPDANILDVQIKNRYGEDFWYEIICPHPVNAYRLQVGQINATAVLVTGPSRSNAYLGRMMPVSFQEEGEETMSKQEK